MERRGRGRAESSRESLIEKETAPKSNPFGRGDNRRWRLNVEMDTASRRQGVEATAPNDRHSHNNSRVDCSRVHYLFFLRFPFPEETRKWFRLTSPSQSSLLHPPFPTVTSLLSRSVTPPTNHIPPFWLIDSIGLRSVLVLDSLLACSLC